MLSVDKMQTFGNEILEEILEVKYTRENLKIETMVDIEKKENDFLIFAFQK